MFKKIRQVGNNEGHSKAEKEGNWQTIYTLSKLQITTWSLWSGLQRHTVSPPYPGTPHPQVEKIQNKNSRKFQKINLNLPHTGNYLHKIYMILVIIGL